MSASRNGLPTGWEQAELGHVIELKYGKALPAKVRDNETHPVFGSNGVVGKHSKPLVTGPILIIGRKGSIGEVHQSDGPCSPIDTTYYIDEFHGQPTRYWYHQVRHLPLAELNRATALPGLNRSDAYSLKIALPPVAEQQRIVAKIESLQERSTRARAALAEVGPLLEQFRRSVLSAAFSGRLTADWRAANPDAQPASELLNRIRTERRQRWEQAELAKYEAKGKKPPKDWQEKYKDAIPLTPAKTAALPNLPPTWQWEPFEAVAAVDSNLVSPDDYPHHWHIAPDNIEKETGQLLSYRTVSDDKVISGKHLFFPGHILYSKIRPYLSKVVAVNFEGLCSADMYPIASHLETRFLFHYMLSSQFLSHVQNQAGNRVVLPKINQKQLCRVPVPVAPAEEQIEIARRMNEATETFAELSRFLLESKSAFEELDQAILAKAFRGELVPQDPADEPAAALLARIAAARTVASTKLNKRTRKPTKQK